MDNCIAATLTPPGRYAATREGCFIYAPHAGLSRAQARLSTPIASTTSEPDCPGYAGSALSPRLKARVPRRLNPGATARADTFPLIKRRLLAERGSGRQPQGL